MPQIHFGFIPSAYVNYLSASSSLAEGELPGGVLFGYLAPHQFSKTQSWFQRGVKGLDTPTFLLCRRCPCFSAC